MSTLTAPRATRVSRTCWFLRHLGEMTVAMLVGMLVYGVLLGSLLTGVGSNLEEGRLD